MADQPQVPLLPSTEQWERESAPSTRHHPLAQLPGLSITLIMAEGIPVCWRNELGVFQALRFIKCFYSITLQLQGAGSSRAAALTCSLAPGLLTHMAR